MRIVKHAKSVKKEHDRYDELKGDGGLKKAATKDEPPNHRRFMTNNTRVNPLLCQYIHLLI
jgi:hypothetical protein